MSEQLNSNNVEVGFYNLSDDSERWEYEKALTEIFRKDFRITKHDSQSTQLDKNVIKNSVFLIWEEHENAEETNNNSSGVGFFNIDEDTDIEKLSVCMQDIVRNDWKIHVLKHIIGKNEDETSSVHVWLVWEEFEKIESNTDNKIGVGWYSIDNEISRKDYKKDLEYISRHEYKIIRDQTISVKIGKFMTENKVLLIWEEFHDKKEENKNDKTGGN